MFIDETESIRRMYEATENRAERESADRPILNVDTQGLGQCNSENNAAGPSVPQSGDTIDQELFDIEDSLSKFSFDDLMSATGEPIPYFVDWV